MGNKIPMCGCGQPMYNCICPIFPKEEPVAMIKRQLIYYIPLRHCCSTVACEAMITKEAINVNRFCLITYETLHTARDTLSTMVVTLVVDIEKCDYVHRAMQTAIAIALSVYSPETDVIHVNDIPVMTRDFIVKEIL